jgi:hypothetical protein
MAPIGFAWGHRGFLPDARVANPGRRITDSDGDDSVGLMPKMSFR